MLFILSHSNRRWNAIKKILEKGGGSNFQFTKKSRTLQYHKCFHYYIHVKYIPVIPLNDIKKGCLYGTEKTTFIVCIKNIKKRSKKILKHRKFHPHSVSLIKLLHKFTLQFTDWTILFMVTIFSCTYIPKFKEAAAWLSGEYWVFEKCLWYFA